jgi:hypothetical protein
MNLPEEVVAAIDYEVGRHDLEYADTYRGYRVGDIDGENEFDRSRDAGCCGSFESNVILENGDKWIIGCNYGH